MKKLHVDLPNNWVIGGESFWATPLGDDLYRIENVPFFAYGLNFLDVVMATPYSDERKPEICKVVTPSGHRTYRLIFKNTVENEKQVELLDSLDKFEASYERADSTNVAIDIKPTGDYLAIYAQLEEYEKSDFLDFETCEERVSGSFDDFPEDQ